MLVKKFHKNCGRTTQGLDITVPLVLTERGIESVTTNQTGKPFDAGTLGKVQRRVLPQ